MLDKKILKIVIASWWIDLLSLHNDLCLFLLFLKSYFVWYKYSYPCLFWEGGYSLKYVFLSFHSQSLCAFKAEVSLLQAIYLLPCLSRMGGPLQASQAFCAGFLAGRGPEPLSAVGGVMN